MIPEMLIDALRADALSFYGMRENRDVHDEAVLASDTRWQAAAALSDLLEKNKRLREALEPFAEFSKHVDEDGWTSRIHRESISTWFGPSDFRRAGVALGKDGQK